MSNFQVYAVNNFNDLGSFCLFQTEPGLVGRGFMPLAWFARYVRPATRVRFYWTEQYSFVWSRGELEPEMIFVADQIWDADLSESNSVEFTLTPDGAYTFCNQTKDSQAGVLQIHQDPSIPPHQVAVGVGMSGSPYMAMPAQPAMTYAIMAHPRYFIAFGDYQEGQVLDVSQINSAQEILFPPEVYTMTAVLNEDGTFTVTPGRGSDA